MQGMPQDGEGGEELAADAAVNQHLTLREDPRFSLFSRNTTIFEHASCPYAPPQELPEGLLPLWQLPGEGMSMLKHRITRRLRWSCSPEFFLNAQFQAFNASWSVFN